MLRMYWPKTTSPSILNGTAVLVAGTADFTKCTANFATAFMKLEAAPKEDCTTTGDETAIRTTWMRSGAQSSQR